MNFPMTRVDTIFRIKDVFSRIYQGAELGDIFPKAEPILYQAYGVMKMAHWQQRRKGMRNRPYWHHPLMVFALVRLCGGSLTDQSAALLHDCAEDMQKSWPGVGAAQPNVLQAIDTQFGAEVAERVWRLTNPVDLEKANKAAWQMAQLEKHPEIVIVKAADKIANGYDTVFDAPVTWTPAERSRQNMAMAEMIEAFKADIPDGLYYFYGWLKTQQQAA